MTTVNSQDHQPSTRAPTRLAEPTAPLVVSARGAQLIDEGGARWFDAATAAFGPGHPAVTAAVTEQLDRVALSSRVLVSRPLARAVAAIAAFCPPPLDLSYVCNSGDEALDFALKLARGAAPERTTVLAPRGEDFGELLHGTALRHGVAVLDAAPLRPDPVEPLDLEDLPARVDRSVAAVVIAPAAPGRPVTALDQQWWRMLRRRCRDSGALLVFDERLTGPARLGSGLGTSVIGVVPDVLVLGEQMGASVVPVGVTVTSRELYSSVLGHRNPTVHGSTFGANPLAAATVVGVLHAVINDDLSSRQQAIGELLDPVLRRLAARGLIAEGAADGGMAWARMRDAAAADALTAQLRQCRILARRDGTDLVSLLPPLTAELDDVRTIASNLEAAVEPVWMGERDRASPSATGAKNGRPDAH